MKIIDISKHNGRINYPLLASKVEGVMVKLSYGYNGSDVFAIDPMADRNIRACKAHNLPVGVYHYSYAKTPEDATNEAIGVARILETYKRQGVLFELPIAIDMEDNKDIPGGDHGGASFAEMAQMCRNFCSYLEAQGYFAMVYASRSWIQQMHGVERFALWNAEWYLNEPTIPCGIWQYTNLGSASEYGTSGDYVDLNVAYEDYPAIIKENGLNGWDKHDNAQTEDRTQDPKPPKKRTREGEEIYLQFRDIQYCFDKNGKIKGWNVNGI